MWKTPLMWKAELTAAPDGAFSAQFGNLITYHVVSRSYGYPAYVEIRSGRGGLRLARQKRFAEDRMDTHKNARLTPKGRSQQAAHARSAAAKSLHATMGR